MHAVGELDHDDADILHHGQQHLAEAFGLPVLGGEDVQLAQLGDAVHAARHFLAEFLADLFDGDAGVLHDVVEQAGLNGHQVHAHVGQDVGDHERMDHVGLAGIAGLAVVILGGETECLFERTVDRRWGGTRESWLRVRGTTVPPGRQGAMVQADSDRLAGSDATLIQL